MSAVNYECDCWASLSEMTEGRYMSFDDLTADANRMEGIDRLGELPTNLSDAIESLHIDVEDDATDARARHCISWNDALDALGDLVKISDAKTGRKPWEVG